MAWWRTSLEVHMGHYRNVHWVHVRHGDMYTRKCPATEYMIFAGIHIPCPTIYPFYICFVPFTNCLVHINYLNWRTCLYSSRCGIRGHVTHVHSWVLYISHVQHLAAGHENLYHCWTNDKTDFAMVQDDR